MKANKAAMWVALAALPIGYCGFLIYHFVAVAGGSLDDVQAMGLGPTVIGLGAVGLLFLIPLVVKLLRVAIVPRAGAQASRALADFEEPGAAFDADAALARYMARKAAGMVEVPPEPDAPPPPTRGFGRKQV